MAEKAPDNYMILVNIQRLCVDITMISTSYDFIITMIKEKNCDQHATSRDRPINRQAD